MAFREYQRAGETTTWDFDEVLAHLLSRGIVLGLGGLGTGADGFVRADISPSVSDATWAAALDAFVPSPDPVRIAQGYLRGRFKAIRAKDPATRTVAERDLLALLTIMRQDA